MRARRDDGPLLFGQCSILPVFSIINIFRYNLFIWLNNHIFANQQYDYGQFVYQTNRLPL